MDRKPEFTEIARHYKDQIINKLRAEQAISLSDNEFERILRPCVAGDFCVAVAKRLRSIGDLTLESIERSVECA